MRYPADHKQQTRERLLKIAGEALRRTGPDGLAVARFMAEAGLTHGGFYAHFRSKSDLVAAAIDRAFDEAGERLRKETADRSPSEGLNAYIRFYLSRAHRDARAIGCPVAALAGDLARLPEPARERFERGTASLTAELTDLIARAGHDDAEVLAASLLAEMIGALALARAVVDPARSNAILAASRTMVQRRLSLEPPL
jgi:TetR/AcrR family transcriptional repressor of nem operon